MRENLFFQLLISHPKLLYNIYTIYMYLLLRFSLSVMYLVFIAVFLRYTMKKFKDSKDWIKLRNLVTSQIEELPKELLALLDSTDDSSDESSNESSAPEDSQIIKCIVEQPVHINNSDCKDLDEQITYLSQKDFENGCYLICKPGKYVLTEDIVVDYAEEEQLNKDGYLDGRFTGNANSARASNGLAIVCDNVTIDGNGYTMSQSLRGASLNRIFTAIQLSGNAERMLARPNADGSNVANPKKVPSGKSTQPICPLSHSSDKPRKIEKFEDLPAAFFENNNFKFGGGGPNSGGLSNAKSKHMSPDDNKTDVGCSNILIENMNFGRSSHFSIHGSDNRGVTIRNCNFYEFEVAALWMNNQIGLTLEDLNIVGLQRYVQPITYLWGFRTQGTGLKGVINASYWGIILNEAAGGAGLIFPPKSGGVVKCPNDGMQAGLQMNNVMCVSPENEDGVGTTGGINHQRTGPRGPIVKNINIANLETQAINGYVLSRETSDGNTVPVLFSVDSLNTKWGTADSEGAYPLDGKVGGGHKGYKATIAVQIEAVKDNSAWYANVVSYVWYKTNESSFTGDKSRLQLFLDSYELHNDDGKVESIPATTAADWYKDLHTFHLVNKSNGEKLDESNLMRLADRAIIWKDANQEGKPLWNAEAGTGLREYRGAKALATPESRSEYLDAHLFNVSNVYYNNGNESVPAQQAYPADQVYCYSDKAHMGQHWYRENDTGDFVIDYESPQKVAAAGWRATKVIALVNSMLHEHAGKDEVSGLVNGVFKSKGWKVNSSFRRQQSDRIPIDFGGHEYNGLVSIHCDRMWGGTFENINIVNSANLRMLDTYGVNGLDKNPVENLGIMNEYTDGGTTANGTGNAVDGFAGSSWGMMMNDSGGNALKNINVYNMIARVGASFAIHSAFGSRGNVIEDSKVLSCSAEQIWGFIADKGAQGNLFKNCTTSNLVGSVASAGFVARGLGNVYENCRAYNTEVVVDISVSDKNAIKFNADDGNKYSYLDASGSVQEVSKKVAIAAGFLLDRDGADEPEFASRKVGHNLFKNCEVHGVIAHGEEDLERNRELGIEGEANRVVVEAAGFKVDIGVEQSFDNKHFKDCSVTFYDSKFGEENELSEP